MKFTKTTLEKLRGYVVKDQGRDVHMAKFVEDTVELAGNTPVRITINDGEIQYAAFPEEKESVH